MMLMVFDTFNEFMIDTEFHVMLCVTSTDTDVRGATDLTRFNNAARRD